MLGTLEACPIEIMPLIIELELTNCNRASAMQRFIHYFVLGEVKGRCVGGGSGGGRRKVVVRMVD